MLEMIKDIKDEVLKARIKEVEEGNRWSAEHTIKVLLYEGLKSLEDLNLIVSAYKKIKNLENAEMLSILHDEGHKIAFDNMGILHVEGHKIVFDNKEYVKEEIIGEKNGE
ncbi:hypothetical protein M0R19_03100 [Candidatus Pacearchaeota archaeon]|nr:hypothetical protein [Candidatus Pacearchaeota archaeon]